MNLSTRLVLLASLAPLANAQTTLRIDVLAGGDSAVLVQPGETVFYRVAGELGGDPGQGLAMFAFDLGFDGGDLAQVSAPASGPILEFVAPRGFNNPAGYGGTPSGGDLLQVGGAMNTIANSFAPTPSGAVVTGVAVGGSIDLATGSVTAPTSAGVYTLEARNVFANALDTQTPAGFWTVSPVEAAAANGLTIVVLDCGAQVFCDGKENSAGCVSSLSSSGSTSLGGSSSLTITVNDALNGQIGMLAIGTEADEAPAFGGTLCVGGTVRRLVEPSNSGGNGAPGTNCTGSFTRSFDGAFLAGLGYGIGDTVVVQWVVRDPQNPDGTGASLSDAAAFLVCP